MKLKPKITIADHFAQMTDPRVERTKQHKLIDIITIAICAVKEEIRNSKFAHSKLPTTKAVGLKKKDALFLALRASKQFFI